MSDTGVLDWTQGGDGIAYQRCAACATVWTMGRAFCPACGHAPPVTLQASGRGIVYAITSVARAPSEALRAHAPYHIVLVDCAEGFRAMAHGAAGLRIGDAVRAEYIDFGGRRIPRFVPITT